MSVNEDLRLSMNSFGARRKPFLFVIDFEAREPVVIPLDEIPDDIIYNIRGNSNEPDTSSSEKVIPLEKKPVPYKKYVTAFDYTRAEQIKGNSYLLNLTFPTEISAGCGLKDIFLSARAKYKLFFKNRFIVFSPESFVEMRGGLISSCPMKGTIDASIPHAEEILLADEKEFSEHLTIVDLIRNDLNSVSSDVRVEKFRYVEKIRTGRKDLLQTSSLITGRLDSDYHGRLGDIMLALLPAGSVTGAPKNKTVEIIKKAEGYKRGFYTGVFGVYDGENLDSGVMIRFIESAPGGLVYKSGGGITIYSECRSEYEEMIDKVYVPIG